MRIVIVKNVPVAERHGINIGNEYDVLEEEGGRNRPIFIMGEAGVKVKVFSHEYDEVPEK